MEKKTFVRLRTKRVYNKPTNKQNKTFVHVLIVVLRLKCRTFLQAIRAAGARGLISGKDCFEVSLYHHDQREVKRGFALL